MKRVVLSIFVAVLLLSGNAFAVTEDFEDGDLTNNPTWSLYTTVGDGYVTSDPIRPDNLVYKGYGTATGHRMLETNLETIISWEDFDLSIEIMATEGYFSLGCDVESEGYELYAGLWLDDRSPGGTDNVVLAVGDTGPNWNSDNWTLIPKSNFSYNQWYNVHTWYDQGNNLIKTELRVLDTDQLIAQASRIPSIDYSTTPGINLVQFGIEETNWQYVDNVILTPEPTTLLLFGLGTFVLRRRA